MNDSIPAVKQQVTECNQNVSKLPTWNGENGMKSIFTNIIGLLQSRGVMLLQDISALGLLSAADTTLAVVAGSGMYGYDPASHSPSLAGDVVANGGGTWTLLQPFGNTQYVAVLGDGNATEFTITHNLNTTFPDVRLYATAQGLPFTLTQPLTMQATSANAVKVTFTTAPALDAYTIIINK